MWKFIALCPPPTLAASVAVQIPDREADLHPAQCLVCCGLRLRGNGSRIRTSRRKPIFTVASDPSSINRKTVSRLSPVMSQYLETEYVIRVNG